MIVNVDDVFSDKPRFSSALYFTMAFVLVMSMAYREGAGELAGLVSLLVMLGCYAMTFGYPLYVYYLFITRRKKALVLYHQHLHALTETEMRALRAHPNLSRYSMRFVDAVGRARFG